MVSTRSKSLSNSEPVKIPTDRYAWIRYGRTPLKSTDGFRSYYKCKHSACQTKKVEYCDKCNSIIDVVYKGQHKHDSPKKVILKGGNVLSTAKSLKRRLIPTHGLEEHLIEAVRNDDATTVIAPPTLNRITRSRAIPATTKANADVAEAVQNVTTRSKPLSASKPIKIPTDSYAWLVYGRTKVKSPEGSRTYFRCKYSVCQAKKMVRHDQYHSIIDVVYKGQHKHDPPNIVTSKGRKVPSTTKSLKGKSISTIGSKEHLTDVVHIDGSEIKQRLKRNSSESSVVKHPKKPKFIVHATAGTKASADSYKWRKYRQKMAKGNSHPRNCYKCTFPGCTVKKHMEKVVDGSSQVIITYKGLHNHDIPAASSHSKIRVPSSFTRSPAMPATPTANADVAEAEPKATTHSKSLPINIPTDGYAWMKYARRQLKRRDCFRSYSKCKYRACQAKKVELCDQFNSVIEVVYRGQHKHDPPKKEILNGGKVLSTAKSLKGKSISTHGLKEHPIEVVHIDGSEIKQGLKRNSSESSVVIHPKKPKFIVHATAGTKVSADSYKWRKYRQKMVKGNSHPRNCYKCAFAGCTVKKQMEKVVDGSSQVIITYKGLHNHDIPAASSHSKERVPSSFTQSPTMPPTPAANADVAETEQKATTRSKSLSTSKPIKIPTDSYAWMKYARRQLKSPYGFRSYSKCKHRACRAKKVELYDQFNSVVDVVYKGQHKHDPPNIVISKGGKDLSTAKSLKGKLISEVVHVDGLEIKQRLKRNSSESSLLKHPKKPKFIVHAAAETKVSSDSYKWRKYREKMVKGNPHPRNCYKCAFAGCTVKKHMEKVVDGSSQVIITYKGLHNHDIPGASSPSTKRGYSATTEAAKTKKSA
ncbi:putative transcription factor WRKY family [Helianthus annuus]|nr:putative transcription factor WRKY family [Helianthus annuus]